jgi:O-succinylbenzoate synthase
MALRASFFKQVFRFNFKARTSRGLMKDKTSWFVRIVDEADTLSAGVGECGTLPGLSVDDRSDYEEVLGTIISNVNQSSFTLADHAAVLALIPPEFPSIIFGMETALLDLGNGGEKVIYRNAFTEGQPISINGLIWMGDLDFMMHQINQKIAAGFTCIKLKVGGLDFDRECDILSYVREKHSREDITIRLDANGAFKVDEAVFKLQKLARFGIHSIEQPVGPGLPEMEELCAKSPIPVAFDEELIGIHRVEEKTSLLKRSKPGFIVLKPSLHGGLSGCEEWISIADTLKIGWWITSALESSVGLNAICQFAARYPLSLPQGLGTGGIYENNISSPLTVRAGHICYDRSHSWDETRLQG